MIKQMILDFWWIVFSKPVSWNWLSSAPPHPAPIHLQYSHLKKNHKDQSPPATLPGSISGFLMPCQCSWSASLELGAFLSLLHFSTGAMGLPIYTLLFQLFYGFWGFVLGNFLPTKPRCCPIFPCARLCITGLPWTLHIAEDHLGLLILIPLPLPC